MWMCRLDKIYSVQTFGVGIFRLISDLGGLLSWNFSFEQHWQDHAVITCSIQKAQQERPDFSEDACDGVKILSILNVREKNIRISPTMDKPNLLLLFSPHIFFQQWVGMLTEASNSFRSRICGAIFLLFYVTPSFPQNDVLWGLTHLSAAKNIAGSNFP